MLVPLWSETNQTLFSDIFNVPPAHVCILTAVDLKLYKVRASADDIAGPQTVCIRRLLHGFDGIRPSVGCGWVYDAETLAAMQLSDTLVHTCTLPWQLTSCRNIGIIGVPGHYRLEMNDSTMVGVAQVYAELLDMKTIPLHVQSLFF